MSFTLKLINYFLGLFSIRLQRIYKEASPNFDDSIGFIIKKKNPVIFDVGANIGQSIDRFKKLFPNSIIHSFEPQKKIFIILKKKYGNDKNVVLNNFALGTKKDNKKLYVGAKSGTSSFSKFRSNTKWIKQRAADLGIETKNYLKHVENVKINTLDNYIKKNRISEIDLLKLDAETHEDKILKGLKKNLNKVNLIECEVHLGNNYTRYLKFYDIEKILNPNRFRLVGIFNVKENNLYKSSMLAVICLYKNLKF